MEIGLRTTKIDLGKEKIRELIGEMEYCSNGFHHLSGAYVKVKNLRIAKAKGRAIADIILCSGEGEPEQRYNSMEYDLEFLQRLSEGGEN